MLAPLDNPEIWADRLKNTNKSIMLVRHLPHLGYLAAILLCDSKEKTIVSFKMVGFLCLKRENNNWSINWMIITEIITED